MQYGIIRQYSTTYYELLKENPNWDANRNDVATMKCIDAGSFLRFVERNGEKVLQQEYQVEITFKRGISFGGSWECHWNDRVWVWDDVPLVMADVVVG